MQETPPEDINEEEKTCFNKEEIKHRPQWLRCFIYVSNKLLYLGLNIFVFFVNRGIFALKALGTFNLFLIIFVFFEWWFYHLMATEFIPEILNKTFNSSPSNTIEKANK